MVYSDASISGLGCVLMQIGKVVAYAWRQLKDHEKNYPTHYFKLASIIFAFQIYLVDKFYFWSKVHRFKYILTMNMRQRRWISLEKQNISHYRMRLRELLGY